MKKIRLLRYLCLAIVFVMLCSVQAYGLSNRDRVLNRISVSGGERYAEIRVMFNFPVRYLRHYPLNYGKEVSIQFEPLQTSRDDLDGLQHRESLFPPTHNPAGVQRVEYEGGDMITPTVTVVFTQPTSFVAKQGEDYRSLLIRIQ